MTNYELLKVFMLENEQWQKAKKIFQTALDLPIAERQTFIEKEPDELIKAEVETLLEAYDEAGNFIIEPIAAIADFVENAPKKSIVGKEIGAYKILEEIGRGGMGAVYLAERADAEFTKKVAVKLIKRGLDTDEIINRFRNERQILANLEHPNIARLLDGGATEDGLPFLVMEFVEGLPLTDFCSKKNLDLDTRLKLFLEVCGAVQYAHRNLTVHRDLKPSNILVSDDGTPKLLDFGIAKLLTPSAVFATGQTATNFNIMTPEYASPEQVRGETVTTATDIYSLGIMLYEILTGNRPYSFENQSLEKIIHTVCHSEPRKPSSILSGKWKTENSKFKIQNSKSLRGDLDNIILMAMRKEPERRYLSVEQFADDIRRYQNGLPVIAREDSFSYRAEKFVKRNKVGVAAAGGVAVSLIAGIFATTRQAQIARRQRDKADKINKFLQKMLASADPRAVGKDAKVVEVLQIAADSIERDFAGSPEIAADLHTTIGLTFLSIGQINFAEPHLTEALEIRQTMFGSENHETALSLNNFGKILQAKGDLKGAENHFRQSLNVLRRVRGTDALDIAAVLGNLGYLLMLEAKYEEAKAAHHEELKILRGRLGENHSKFAHTLGNLANIYNVTGDAQTAEPMHRKALFITENFYEKDHPDTASAMLHLAISIANSKPDEAESLVRKSLELRKRFFGIGHSETAWSLTYLAFILVNRKKYEEAELHLREVLSQRGKNLPEEHLVINSSLLLLGGILTANGDFQQAKNVIEESIKLRRQTLPEGHWLIATANSYLGECLFKLGEIEHGKRLLIESYKTLKEQLGENHEQTKQARLRRQSAFN